MLLKLINTSLSYSDKPLLDQVNFLIEKGEKVCLLGRNGAGKSTLLKIISGEIQASSGQIEKKQGLKIATLAQEVPANDSATVFDIVAEEFGEAKELLSRYHEVLLNLDNDAAMAEMSKLQHQIDQKDYWQIQHKVDAILSKLSLDPDAVFSSLSGGWKRRVFLAKALVNDPDLLLLDEPTNHLDIEAVEWLEDLIQNYNGAVLFISHDRRFVKKLATRIIELDRGKLTSYSGNYDTYLRQKEEMLNAEEQENKRFDKKLAQEEVWIRQGIKARRTRNEGRVRALKKMREERAQRRVRQGTAKITIESGGKSGALVIEANKLSCTYDGRKYIDDFSCKITRGDKIGIIGENGCGKTTLLKMLLGKIDAEGGNVRHGTKLEVAYFDQLREKLDLEKSVLDNLAQGQSFIEIGDKKQHVLSYLQDFLFAPGRSQQPVKALSGGERNRLLLAKLFTKPANLLVMDEPTNDLDLETLELLESLLVNYKGTVLLVCHDREFIDNVVTSTIAFGENGQVSEYVGGYDDYLRQKPKPSVPVKEKPKPKPEKARPAKRSYQDERELKNLPGEIEALEKEIEAIQHQMVEPGFYDQAADEVAAVTEQLNGLEKTLQEKYARWEELDA